VAGSQENPKKVFELLRLLIQVSLVYVEMWQVHQKNNDKKKQKKHVGLSSPKIFKVR
jgi:hypothetical protein